MTQLRLTFHLFAFAGLLASCGWLLSGCEEPADASSPSETPDGSVQVALSFAFSDENSNVPRAGEPELLLRSNRCHLS